MTAYTYVVILSIKIPAIEIIHKAIAIIIDSVIWDFAIVVPYVSCKVFMLKVNTIVNNTYYDGIACGNKAASCDVP